VGTASWTGPALIEAGWYPAEATTPEQRLRYYASRFPLAEGDITMHLQVVPPLSYRTAWIEVLLAGQPAEVHATLPLRWQ
jgi:hypothetical protein